MQPLKARQVRIVPGLTYGSPKEVWGFRTKPTRGRPERVAQTFLETNEELLGLRGLRLRHARILESLGAHHVIHQQRLKGLPIHRAYATVHMDRKGRVYLVKNRAVPKELLEASADFQIAAVKARRIALRCVIKKKKSVAKGT